MSPATHRGLALGLLLVAALWLATLAADRAPAARPLDAAPTQFSGERARALLQGLVGDARPHPLGSRANAELRERLLGALRALGLTPTLQSGVMVCTVYGVCGMPINIVARIQGADGASERAVLLAAHYDSVAAGPGASDNGVGVAAVLEIARILQRLPRPRQSIIVLLEDGEEVDLLGAHAFVEHHPWAATVTAAVNLDARGTSGPSLMFETGSANRWLMRLYAEAIARPLTNSVYYAVYKLLPNDTDFTVFKAAGWQGFNFAFIGDVAHYHTPLDDWPHTDAGSIQNQGDNALATVLALANAGDKAPPSGEAVYFDLFGRLLVRLPQAWAWPAALIVLLLVIAAGVRLLHLRLLSARALLWGIAGLGAALLLGGAGAAAILAVLRAMGTLSAGGAATEVAHPWALELGFAALAFFVTALIGARLQRQAGFWGLWGAGALLCALLGLVLARWLPGASYLALLPALAGLIALIPAMRPASGARARAAWLTRAELAGVSVCVVSFVLVLPIVLPLYSALGGEGLPLLTVLLIYSSFSLAGLLALAGSHWQRRLILAAALCTGAGLIGAALLPRYSPESPQRLNLSYEFDADAQRARWLAYPASAELPARLRRAAPFVPDAQPVFPWNAPLWAADAPSLPLPAPQLSILKVAVAAARAHYRIHIGSARTAAVLDLAFPPEARVQSVQLESDAAPGLPATPRRMAGGWSQLRLFSVPPEGQDLSFDAAASAFELKLLDESPGLPPQGADLQRLRLPLAVPSQDGDVSIAMRGYRLQPSAASSERP
jgi:hypothetical protein